jgi:prevent-host-death family protein
VSGQTVSSSSNEFESYMERVACNKERVRIMRHGQEIAAIIPIEDLDLLEELEDRLDVLEALEAIEEAKAHGGVISWEQFVADLEG